MAASVQPFTPEQELALRDLAAFIEFTLRTGKYDFATVRRTLDHDAIGLGHDDDTFLPKTAGYTKLLADLREVVAS